MIVRLKSLSGSRPLPNPELLLVVSFVDPLWFLWLSCLPGHFFFSGLHWSTTTIQIKVIVVWLFIVISSLLSFFILRHSFFFVNYPCWLWYRTCLVSTLIFFIPVVSRKATDAVVHRSYVPHETPGFHISVFPLVFGVVWALSVLRYRVIDTYISLWVVSNDTKFWAGNRGTTSFTLRLVV